MHQNKTCFRCAQTRKESDPACSRSIPQKTASSVQREFLWWEDQPTDDPVPNLDPQSGDVTDGSVDYFDFDWGDMVIYDEATMERALFRCTSQCGNGCFGYNEDNRGEECGEGEEERRCSCDTDSECVTNRPVQEDESLYEILPE